MASLTQLLKRAWLWMLEPPWQHSGPVGELAGHWGFWLLGWVWALAGLVVGALVAPAMAQYAGLSNTPYQDPLVIAMAVLTGFLVQLLGWVLLASLVGLGALQWPELVQFAAVGVVDALPLLGVYYALNCYLTWVGPGQRAVTVAFVGSLLVKTFAIPFIKGIVTGALFRWFMKWLRGGKPQKSA